MCYLLCQQLTVIKDQLTLSFLVDNEDALVSTAAQAFDVNEPIYVGGVPHGFLSPVETLVRNDSQQSLCCSLLSAADVGLHCFEVLSFLTNFSLDYWRNNAA